MRTETKTIKIYNFDELNEDIKNTVINNYIEILLTTVDISNLNKNTNLYKAIKKAEDMRTPWFSSQYVWEFCRNSILKDVKKYEYLENGTIYQTEV